MNELQTSLIAIGGIIVVGVLSYNKWQEWRAKKSVDNAFSPLHEDVLMGAPEIAAQRHEPVMTGEVPASSTVSVNEANSPLPDVDSAVPAGVQAHESEAVTIEDSAQSEPVPAKPSPLDADFDCIIPLALDAPVRGEKIKTLFHALRLIGNKPVQIVGLTKDGNWEPVAHGSVYQALEVGVQLASRSGPLSEMEYSELVTSLNQMMDELGAQPAIPDMQDVIGQARELHQLIQEFDAQLSINVQASSAPWLLSTLRPALQRQGMELRPDGRLIMPDGEGGMLFSLHTNTSQTDESSKLMTLLLPVPLVSPQRNGFGAMTAFAKSLASRLSGKVVDDSGQLLGDAALEEIAAQVESFYQAMDAAGVAGGSSRAQRLFG